MKNNTVTFEDNDIPIRTISITEAGEPQQEEFSFRLKQNQRVLTLELREDTGKHSEWLKRLKAFNQDQDNGYVISGKEFSIVIDDSKDTLAIIIGNLQSGGQLKPHHAQIALATFGLNQIDPMSLSDKHDNQGWYI